MVCRAVVRCDGVCRSSLAPHVGWRGGVLLVLRSSSRGSVRAAGLRVGGSLVLRGSSRLIGAGGGEVRLSPSACLDGAGEECVDCVNCLFSVDYFGGGGYIDTRALIVFSFLCFLARAFMLAALQWFSVANIALVYRPHESVPPGHERERFFLSISISSHLSAACLRVRFLLLDYSHIHFAPLLAPLPSTRRTGRLWAAIRLTEGGLLSACLMRAAMDGDGADVAAMLCLLDFTRAAMSFIS